MSKLMFGAAAAAFMMAVPAVAQMTPGTPTQYVQEAGASDKFEIDEAKLMLQSTQNPQIRQFAEKMIHDHTQSTDMVKNAAMKAGMHPAAPQLTTAQQTQYRALKLATGTTRDKLYIDQQLPAHQQALALQRYYASNGSSAPLKQAAAKIVPVVQNHIDMLKAISSHMS